MPPFLHAKTPLLKPSALAAFALALVLAAAGCASSSETTGTAQADSTQAPPVPRVVPRTVPEQPTADARLDTVRAGRFDQGKMWTFDNPPVEYFQEEYGFAPDEAWFRQARLGALRIPGCTASFVSPHGLVLTNHHCGRDWAARTSRNDERILENGFYAETLNEERPVDGLYADQLIAIEDVTGEVERALENAQTDAERAEARRQATEAIQERIAREAGGERAGIRVEVISLYNGGQFSAYTFRRYENLRLVMIPELAVGYFGGDLDNFTYPRYTLDMSLFRVYTDAGEPLSTENYFAWSEEGTEPDEAVFVVGNPGSTLRLETVAQLEYRRDVQDRSLLDFLETRVAALEAYTEAQSEVSEEVQNELFGLKNALKLYRGRVKALNDPVLMARRADAEKSFVEAIDNDPSLREEYGDLVDSLALVQEEKRAYAAEYGAFRLITSPYASATLRRALLARQLLNRQEAGASESATAELREQLLGIGDQPDALEERYLTARLEDFQRYFGRESEVAEAALGGRTPEAAARQILDNSALSDSAGAAEAVQSGTLTMDDPALALVESFYGRYQDFQSAQAGLDARQDELARRLGRARFAVYGTSVPPDATFSLRLADGRVQGYDYNGTFAAPYTTFYGMYSHFYTYGDDDDSPWDLPERWLSRRDTLALSTPFNLVSTNDITGGNSGSPLLNQDLELVGLIFDGNIESLASDYIYRPERARAVSVDSRGMLEALRAVYEADRIAQELTTGDLIETDAAAEARASRR